VDRAVLGERSSDAGGVDKVAGQRARPNIRHPHAEHAPLVRAINNALAASIDGSLPEGFFLDILRRGFSDDEARHQLDIAIDWGRYGELYEYDANTGQLQRERRSRESNAAPVEA
jgi:hypothetical protein